MATDGNMIEQYMQLHQAKLDYGSTSIMYFEEVSLFIAYLKPATVLDYGCGKGVLLEKLTDRFPEVTFYGYDPAIPGRDTLPVQKADLVINTDVLEHIPEHALPDIIKEISLVSENVFFGLHHALANQILPNGENAHCTVKPPIWYFRLFSNYFYAVSLFDGRNEQISVAVTFPVTPRLIVEYYDLIKSPLFDTFYKRMSRWIHWRLARTHKKLKRAWGKLLALRHHG